jgi:branched-chain amino acid transport system permease protein
MTPLSDIMRITLEENSGAGDAGFGRRWYAKIALIISLLVALMAAPAMIGTQSYALHVLMSIFLFAILGHAWNLIAGFAGMLSFGQQAFIGLGGYAQAFLIYYASVSVWTAWPVSGVAASAFAWLLCLPIKTRGSRRRVMFGVTLAILASIGYEALINLFPDADVFQSTYVRRESLLLLIFLGALPLLKLRGAYFAIATWLIAEAVATVFSGWSVSGAGGGMQLKSEVTQLQLYYVALALLTITTGVILIWMHSYQGLALTAIRDDEDAAQSSGVDVDRVKMLVFIYGAAITGLASGLYFMDVIIITPPSAFSISWAAYIVFIVVAGGMGTIAGPLVGAVLFIVIERLLGAAAGQGLLVLGILSILLMLFLPRGVMGILGDISHKWRHRSLPLAETPVLSFAAQLAAAESSPRDLTEVQRSSDNHPDDFLGGKEK